MDAITMTCRYIPELETALVALHKTLLLDDGPAPYRIQLWEVNRSGYPNRYMLMIHDTFFDETPSHVPQKILHVFEELPRKAEGEVDWEIVGAILTTIAAQIQEFHRGPIFTTSPEIDFWTMWTRTAALANNASHGRIRFA